MKKIIILVEALLLSSALFSQSNKGYDNNSLCGVDQFGRSFYPITGNKVNRYVGILYEPWLGQEPGKMPGIYDNTKILAADSGNAYKNLFNLNGTPVSPYGQFHFWGEPLQVLILLFLMLQTQIHSILYGVKFYPFQTHINSRAGMFQRLLFILTLIPNKQ